VFVLGGGDAVRTYDESQPKFLKDIKNTFAMLGSAIGSVSLVVAAITLFIVIFINAITRRKQIGVLKGLGISGLALESAYVLQAFVYGVIGSGFGIAIIYGLAIPYIAEHPIDFPFSDGIMVAEVASTVSNLIVLLITTVIAGYIPARMIVKKNTLDSILGRN
jgi:putative ABC transport system permease protein